MAPKRDKTMLLVACAVSAQTSLAACGDDSTGCMGFYASDATTDVAQQPDAYYGFYPLDASADGDGDSE